MHPGNPQNGDSNNKQWPDFYSILDSSPETDGETLRRSINTLYVKANEQSDHRELNTRFYNQVLTQKVLPQCRRILLNEQARQAYNQQWYLHRDGAETALSYQDFIREISKDASTARTLLLSNDEISILPSFGADSGAAPLSALKTSGAPLPVATPADSQPVPVTQAPEVAESTEVIEGEEVVESSNTSLATSSPNSNFDSFVRAPAAPAASAEKKGFPILPALGGLVLLGIGGIMWNSSRQMDETPALIHIPTHALVATPTPKPRQFLPVTADVTLKSPLSLSFDAMEGNPSGDAKIAPGLQGNALTLDGNGSVELEHTIDTSKSYTVMAWVRLTAPPNLADESRAFQSFISADGPLASAFFLQFRGDTKRFGFIALPQDGGFAKAAGAKSGYKVNTWYHLAGVRDEARQTIKFYMDGILQASETAAPAFKAPGTLRLGRAKFNGDPVDFVKGQIDNVQFFQRALSGSEIYAIAKPLLAKAKSK